MPGVDIVPYAPRFASECRELIDALPDWFGIAESNAAYLRNLELLLFETDALWGADNPPLISVKRL